MQSTCYKSVEAAAEEASDPGLIILYDAAVIHTALAQPNSPIPQRANIDQSPTDFKHMSTDK